MPMAHMRQGHVAIVGAGIVGLAHAYAAARRGANVTVFERDSQARGASVRNFGLGLVLGQARGELFDLALQSRALWLELLPALGLWHKAAGSLTVARDAAQLLVLQAFQEHCGAHYGTALRSANDVAALGLHGMGALYSPHEIALEARRVLPAMVQYLQQRHGVQFHFDTLVRDIALPAVHTSRGRFDVDEAVVCAGHDFQTLFPAQFEPLGLRRCALQMLRLADPGLRVGPALLTGLSTLHYPSFTGTAALAPALSALREQVRQQAPAVLQHGVHLIVQQLESGELIVGDSHDYDASPAPFGHERVDRMLLDLAGALLGRPLQVLERWQGIYASGPQPYERLQVDRGVTAIAITSGIGMSIALALAERWFEERLQ